MEKASGEKQFLDTSLEDLGKIYHIPILVLSIIFMLYIRLRYYDRFFEQDTVLFSSSDPYYHYHQTKYTVENWPWTSSFDPFTQFPFGNHAGQFGTLFDQIAATIALVIGLGNPSDETIRIVLIVLPAVFAALTAVPVYLLAKKIGGRLTGVIAVVFLSLFPGEFLSRSVVGYADHHSAEVFFQAFSVLALFLALKIAAEEAPVFELILTRDWNALIRPLKYSIFAGFLVGLYVWVWPPGVVLIGIFGIFVVFWMVNEFRSGGTPEPVGFVAVVSMLTATLLIAIQLDTLSTSTATTSLVHIFIPFSVAIGALLLSALARLWERKRLSGRSYVGFIALLTVLAFLFVRTAMPSVYSTVMGNIDRVFIPARDISGTETIGEARPSTLRADSLGVSLPEVYMMEYGLIIFVASVGLLYMIFLDESHRPEFWFISVWAILLGVMSIAQVRFHYYLVIPVAIYGAYALVRLLKLVGLDSLPSRDSVNWSQIFVVGIILVLVVPVLFIPIPLAQGVDGDITTNNVFDASEGYSTPGEVAFWQGSLEWMEQHTPQQGTLGGADNPMEPYASYERPVDDNFEYPEGAYGVMAWWDYGHWITAESNRIPYANPFQQGTTEAAHFLYAPSEERANEVVDSLGDDHEEMRYVMIDWQIVTPGWLMGAPPVFYEDEPLSSEDLVNWEEVTSSEFGQIEIPLKQQRYHESMANRLYEYHGSAMTAQPVVIQLSDNSGQVDSDQPVITFDSVEEAQEYVNENPNAKLGGIGPYPEEDVEALEQHRLVHQSDEPAFIDPSYNEEILTQASATGLDPAHLHYNYPAWVKTFERVDGGIIKGEGPSNETVFATVQMDDAETGEQFIYQQLTETDSDGNFEMKVPYSTTGYDEWGTDKGYTDIHIQSTGPYTVSTEDGDYVGEVDVTEGQVIGEESEESIVILEEAENENDLEEERPDEDIPDE